VIAVTVTVAITVMVTDHHNWESSARSVRNKTLTQPLSEFPHYSEDAIMDKDRIKGSAEQTKGAVKEAAGKILGDKKLETEGKVGKAAGKVQNAVGGLKDAVRGNQGR
jgi:uncharacterized protein YjbJ (UPF0337 family)